MSTAHVLVVDDEADIRALISEILIDEGFSVTVAEDAAAAREARTADQFDLVLLDIWMPDTDGISLLREWSSQGALECPVVIMSGHGTVDTAVEATRLGATDFVEKPLSIAKLLRTVERSLEDSRRKAGTPRNVLPSLLAPVGRSEMMKKLRETVKKYAAHDSPVLISGEPGTGRGAFARYIHMLSQHAGDEPIMLLASSLTESNAEEQLLGSEKNGAVTAGYFERAAGSTLIIEELTDLSAAAQKLIIGVLEQGSFLRYGGSQPIAVKARVLATVVDDFEALIDAGKLRRELVANINILNLRVPPLREYAEDVPELLSYYVDKLVDAEGLSFRRFSVAAQNRLRNYPWPDNVRELKNLVRRMLMTGSEEEISLDEIEADVSANARVDEPLVKQDLLALPLREAREQFERAYLQQQLVLCNGKVGKLAKRVGMERTHLYRKLRSLGVDFRSAASED
ncbi:MAG: sigma-54-dependent Fis family transcriptional regulator [Woeseia sp.]|nr:sigma-54 dependent transcriptional regulator [Woeseia sp.]MBT8097971.1 sigma-54 dependent transcriptional regulator [Woeseia sp.]NNE60772.1 sigma-54-dependent Fis family transcriptional regulator [Woeseia sp.]NNL55380.1 sigma-54-dependent Fis family transcriptional regulator [Woeseia sp.]